MIKICIGVVMFVGNEVRLGRKEIRNFLIGWLWRGKDKEVREEFRVWKVD